MLGLGLACARQPASVAPVVPEREAPAVAHPRQPVEPAPLPQAVPDPMLQPDSLARLRQVQDSSADAAALEQLALAHAPAPAAAPSQAGDPLDWLTEPRAAALDLTTFADHGRVRYYLDFFQGPARSRMAIWLTRLPVYEPMVRERFAAEGLPGDLVYLGLIESGFSNVAVSRSRAVGMWQFMRGTGRWMGLRIDRWVDERRDPVKATDAAARYLAKLTEQFGSHYLAAAAYNAGPGTVSRGLGRIDWTDGTSNSDGAESADADEDYSDDDFFTLADTRYIRQETKDYVPKLIAAALIARNPTSYGFEPIPVADPFPRDSVVVPDMTSLDVIARLAGVSGATIRELNPHYLRGVTPPSSRAVLRLPAGTMERASAAYADLPAAERVGFPTHVVKSGETLSRIAKRYGVSVTALREVNPGIRSGSPRVGQRLAIPTGSAARWSDYEATRGTARLHTVQRGETLSGIAKRYHVSMAQLRSWNRLPASGAVRAGQKLRVGSKGGGQKTAAATLAATRRTHVVQRGETLTGLARRYGVSVQALQDVNGIKSARSLRAGQKLRIPA
jgi:membrane-bound lytic murein transglycosylase D